MEISSKELLKFTIFQEHPEIVEQIHLVLKDLFNSSLSEAKDFSVGCDQLVFYLKTTTNNEVILKIPKSSFRDPSDSSFFPMHLPHKQAWFLDTIIKCGVLAPKLIYLDPSDKFLIETFIPEANYSERETEFTEEEKKTIMNDLGKTMKKLHNLKSYKFGYISDKGENEGKFENWLTFFDGVPDSIKNCCAVMNFEKEIEEKLENIWNSQKAYLSEFSDSRLLHADLDFNNMRVQKLVNKWTFSGLIDFADILSGDPLLDFGEFLGSCGDWKVIFEMEKSYLEGQRFTEPQMNTIRFYAIYYLLWWLEVSNDKRKREFYTRILKDIIDEFKM